MNQSKSSNQQKNSKQQNSNPSIVSSDQAQPMVQNRASGSALQDVQAETRADQPNGAPVKYPAATNYSDANPVGDDKTADASSIDGPFETDQSSKNQGRVSLQNNPNAPEDDEVQGNMPDTNPIGRSTSK